MHVTGAFLLNATFTADSHRSGEPENLELTPLTSVVMGGENNHADHHAKPWDPRHGQYDPGYAVIRGLEIIGQAEVPARTAEV